MDSIVGNVGRYDMRFRGEGEGGDNLGSDSHAGTLPVLHDSVLPSSGVPCVLLRYML